MKQLKVESREKTYPIFIEKGIRHKFSQYLKSHNYSQILIISDEQVSNYYLEDVKNSLNDKFTVNSYIVKAGEQAKSISTYENIQQYLLKQHVDRHSAIIALGGGVVGDLAGFVAATYMRGISFIQAPTTLLAHDSSIGGKVAINLDQTKNIIGSIYPPDFVLYDTETLCTLPDQELRSGFAEMLKHGFLSNTDLLNRIRSEVTHSINPMTEQFDELLLESIKVKQKIVEQDELESDVRKHLNLGHTLGHAIETITPHTHGECVMYGLLFSLYVSEQIQGVHNKLLTIDLIKWINHLRYPLNIITEIDVDVLVDKMLNDKKAVNQKINFVLLKDVGKPFLQELSTKDLKRYLLDFMEKMN